MSRADEMMFTPYTLQQSLELAAQSIIETQINERNKNQHQKNCLNLIHELEKMKASFDTKISYFQRAKKSSTKDDAIKMDLKLLQNKFFNLYKRAFKMVEEYKVSSNRTSYEEIKKFISEATMLTRYKINDALTLEIPFHSMGISTNASTFFARQTADDDKSNSLIPVSNMHP